MVQCSMMVHHNRKGFSGNGIEALISPYIPVPVSLTTPAFISRPQCASSKSGNLSTGKSSVRESSSNESCSECLYTGVATCAGLSLYFMKLASEIPSAGRGASKEVLTKALKQKHFLLGGSATWAVCGVYRIYLG